MVHDVAVVVGVGAAARAVDELVEHDEIARGDIGTERSDRARPEHRAHTERAQRPEVGSLRDAGRRNRVTRAVTRDERDPSIADVPIATGPLGAPYGVSTVISSTSSRKV